MKTLVVSRFNEEINWTKQIKDWNVIIYNKGEMLDVVSIALPNVGREAETYLNFIVNNYHDLCGLYGFVQGNPFGNGLSDNEKIILDINSTDTLEGFSYFKNSRILYSDLNGLPDHNTGIDIIGYCTKFGIKVPEKLEFTPGAQFVVCSNSIKARPLDFYKNLLNSVNNSIKPNEAYILERLWFYIFKHYKDAA
jgi:hypothetical protein